MNPPHLPVLAWPLGICVGVVLSGQRPYLAAGDGVILGPHHQVWRSAADSEGMHQRDPDAVSGVRASVRTDQAESPAPSTPPPPTGEVPQPLAKIHPALWVVAVLLSAPGALLAYSDGLDPANGLGRVGGSVLLPFAVAFGLASLSKPRSNQRVMTYYCLVVVVLTMITMAARLQTT